MATCSVCGEVQDSLIHTCNHCGRKHCPEHQLPENHICIPSKSDLSSKSSDSRPNWSSKKHKRTNVMEGKRRSRREKSGDEGGSSVWSDSHPDLKRHGHNVDNDDDNDSGPLDDEEGERSRERECMDRRLSGNTETKRPLDEDEIDADTDSSPGEWVEDVKRNREELNERLAERHQEWEAEKATDSADGQAGAENPSQGSGGLPNYYLALLLVALMVAGYVLLSI